MSKTTGLGHRLYVDGVNVSGDIGAINTVHGGPAALDMTGIDKLAIERQGGVRDGEISFTAFFNDTGAHLPLKTLPTADRVVTYGWGATIGAQAANCVAKQVNYDPSRGTDAGLTLAVQALADGFGVEWGDQLTPGIRTDVAATNGASLDGLAASTFGFQAYLHVFAFTGTTATVKVQDSADNVSFADVTGGAFAAVTTGPQSQRIAGSPASLRQYLRIATTGTFSNLQFAVSVVRNLVATAF